MENIKALNIICTIGNSSSLDNYIDISNKSIESFEVERNISDIGNQFSMTLIDTPDTNITYDLEIYMTSGYRDITIKYGDTDFSKFVAMRGTIYNYTYNFVGNIKKLVITGIASTYAQSNMVGSIKYNIDWNSYVNKRRDIYLPWNITKIQDIATTLSEKTFLIKDSNGNDQTVSGSNLTSSFILNSEYHSVINYNTKFQRITSPTTGNTVSIPIPDLFVELDFPIEDLMGSTAIYDPVSGKINDDVNHNIMEKYRSSNTTYHEYFRVCNDNANYWWNLTPYLNLEDTEPDNYSYIPDISIAQDAYKIKLKLSGYNISIAKDTPVVYSAFSKDPNKYTSPLITITDDFGDDVNYDYTNDGFCSLKYLMYLLCCYGQANANHTINYNGYKQWQKLGGLDNLYEDIFNNKKFFGELKVTSINGGLYVVSPSGEIVSNKVASADILFRFPPSLAWLKENTDNIYLKVSSISDSTIRNALLNGHSAYGHSRLSIYTLTNKSTNSASTVSNPTTSKVTQLVWKQDDGAIRAFSYNGKMYVQAKPNTPAYTQATMLTSGVGVSPSEIVRKLAALEGWDTRNDIYIAPTTTMANSDTFIMHNCSAIEFINANLIPNSVTVSGVYKTKSGKKKYLNTAQAGYNLYFDNNAILHYHPITKDQVGTLKLEMGYNYPNSPVLTFSVNTKGTAFYTYSTKQFSTLSIVTGEEVSSVSGLTSSDSYIVAKSQVHNAFLDAWYGTTYQEAEQWVAENENKSIQAYYDSIISTKYVTSFVKSGAFNEAEVIAAMNESLDKIQDFTVTGTLSMIGNCEIRPSNYVTIINMIKGAGYRTYSGDGNFSNATYNSNDPVMHPSSGIYMIISQKDKFDSSSGFIQELNLIKKTQDFKDLLEADTINYGIHAKFFEES